ncbi:MAG: polyprenol monophosphomannose synthase [Candidatus Omnitrophota bacterium]
MKVAIVIPTYNERENVETLVEEILSLDKDFHLIFVDDNSSDGTGKILDNLKEKYIQLQVIHRTEKLGLGSAYRAGFKFALKNQFDFIFQMDADFSHSPQYIPQMLSAIKDCDLVIGSRYIEGGRIKNWPPSRRLLSGMANLYVHIVTGMPIHDATGGFKCFRKEVLEEIDLDKISSDGYAFQIEMNYLVWKKNFQIKEIPIIFYERRKGKSKLNRKIIWEALWLVWRLRLFSKY